ncbi:MAG TPA: dihydrolipoamide acetyltransferase family protein [Anaerolineales bacterium]
MAYEITLPRLGWDMEEGALAAWLKADGEFVNAGELLFSVEGDKAVQEIEALDSGVLRILPDCPAIGSKVPVGTLLGYLVPTAEMDAFSFSGQSPAAPAAAAPIPSAAASPASAVPEPTKTNGRPRRVYISPYARRLAQGLGVEWQNLSGSGLNGRIMAKDVERAAQTVPTPTGMIQRPAPTPAPVPVAPAAVAQEVRIPLSGVRRQTAEHMARSARTVAPVTLTSEVDATEIVRLRSGLKKESADRQLQVPSYNDILAKLCAQALLEFPAVNARLEGEEIVQIATPQIAIAVDSERGLLAPVLRDVSAKSLRQVARDSAGLIAQARLGQLPYEALQGATFTITNLGMFEIDAFTPIIDLPQCAILGVGRIVPKQVVVDFEHQQLAIRQMMVLSLTFDHRLVDGAGAARFLQRVKHYIEDPYLWLAGS